MNRTKREILNKIKKENIKMRPRWQFLMEEVEIKVGVVILLCVVGVSLSVVVLYEDEFPFLWLSAAMILGVLVVLMEKRVGENYRLPKRWLALVSVGIVLILTTIIVLVRKMFRI